MCLFGQNMTLQKWASQIVNPLIRKQSHFFLFASPYLSMSIRNHQCQVRNNLGLAVTKFTLANFSSGSLTNCNKSLVEQANVLFSTSMATQKEYAKEERIPMSVPVPECTDTGNGNDHENGCVDNTNNSTSTLKSGPNCFGGLPPNEGSSFEDMSSNEGGKNTSKDTSLLSKRALKKVGWHMIIYNNILGLFMFVSVCVCLYVRGCMHSMPSRHRQDWRVAEQRVSVCAHLWHKPRPLAASKNGERSESQGGRASAAKGRIL